MPVERKATEGSPQNVFSRLFYQYQMSFSLLGRSRSVPFLNCLSWFLAGTLQGCFTRASCCCSILGAGNYCYGCVCFSQLFSPQIPYSQPDVLPWGHTLPIPNIPFVCHIYSGSSSSLELSASHSLPLLVLSPYNGNTIPITPNLGLLNEILHEDEYTEHMLEKQWFALIFNHCFC